MCNEWQIPNDALLFLSDARGIYIPRDFINATRAECISNISPEDRDILLAGPDHKWYWEAWDAVLDNARVTDPKTGTVYSLYQEGDLWLIPETAGD